MSSRLPNIILIVIDCARADHFGCYGKNINTTPQIDALADKSQVYQRAYSSAGWTLPSFASMFTGTYPSKHGAHNENRYLSSQFPTLAELLANQGYRTMGVCFNDWLSDATGMTRGFQEFHQPAYTGVQRYFKRLVQYPVVGGRDAWSYDMTQVAKKLLLQKSHTSPFFMTMHFMDLHLPYHIPDRYVNKFLPSDITKAHALKVQPGSESLLCRQG